MKTLINKENLTRSEFIMRRLFECIHNGEVENTQLVEIFKRVGIILNLQTPKIYAENNNISVQAAHKKPFELLFGVKFIVDNE